MGGEERVTSARGEGCLAVSVSVVLEINYHISPLLPLLRLNTKESMYGVLSSIFSRAVQDI
jgi:hypothetical protein